MKQFIVAIFLCVASCALVNASQRKIAYERGEKIFVADADRHASKENCARRVARNFAGRHTRRV